MPRAMLSSLLQRVFKFSQSHHGAVADNETCALASSRSKIFHEAAFLFCTRASSEAETRDLAVDQL